MSSDTEEGRKEDEVSSDAVQDRYCLYYSINACMHVLAKAYIVVVHSNLASILKRKMDSHEDLHLPVGS